MSRPLTAGDAVRVLTGIHGDTIGRATYVDPATGTVHVELTVPLLITQPEGPSEVRTLPYGPRELELLPVASMSCPCGFDVALPPGHTAAERAEFDEARDGHIRGCSAGWTVTEGRAA